MYKLEAVAIGIVWVTQYRLKSINYQAFDHARGRYCEAWKLRRKLSWLRRAIDPV